MTANYHQWRVCEATVVLQYSRQINLPSYQSVPPPSLYMYVVHHTLILIDQSFLLHISTQVPASAIFSSQNNIIDTAAQYMLSHYHPSIVSTESHSRISNRYQYF